MAKIVSGKSSNPQIPVGRFQKIIGQKMLASKRQIPCFYLQAKADLTELMALRHKLAKTVGAKVTTNDFFIRAIALAVKQYPLMAGKLDGNDIHIAKTVNVGLAVVAPRGLIVPVLKNADKKTLAQIATESAELIKKARSDSLTADELADACITLTNLGVYGIDSFIAIVTPGQCAVLAVGNIIEELIPTQGNIEVRRIMTLNLAADRRIVTSPYAAKFINHFVQHLQNPKARCLYPIGD